MDIPEQNNQKKENFLNTGLMLDNRFKIIEPVRKTSGCIVYRAWDYEQETDKALLMIPPIIQADFEAMEILKQSARSLKWLNHIYIAGFYGLHTRGQHSYFEMEFVPGKSIKRKKYESRDKRFSENMARWVALQILEGLAYAHNQNVLHRNIKPQKIIFTGKGQVRIIDFGVSEALRNAMALVRDISSRSAILFMPPEQLRGKNLSVQSDIYSLGAALYYLLDGKPPFYHGDIHYQILNEQPEPIEGVSDELNNIILKCLSKDIDQRYENCEQMMLDIRKLSAMKEEKVIEPQPVIEKEDEEKIDLLDPSSLIKEKVEEKSDTFTLINEEPFDEKESIIEIFINKIKMNKSILIWVGLFFIVVISVIGFKVIVNSNDGGGSGFYSGDSNRDKQTRQRMIAALNTAADKQFAEGRYIIPEGNNALELYLEVLKIDSDEEHARSRIESMKDKLYADIQRYLDDWMLIEAEELLESCLDYFEDDGRFEKLEDELNDLLEKGESLPVQIEILNGAGQSGVANTLGRHLEKNGYKVVHKDNYRVNGMVNWQVGRTLFIGSLPESKRIEKLEKILNLKYQRDKLSGKQFKSANILIILGADCQKIPALN